MKPGKHLAADHGSGRSEGSSGRVLCEVSANTARITIDRPRKLNAFDTELYGQFRDAILSLKDADVDLVVIQATGRAFSTGGDLSEVRDLVDSGAGLQAFFDKLPFRELRECRATTIARVQGPCLAGGAEIALCCDLILASRSATFGFAQARIGLADTTAPALLQGRVPYPRLTRLLYTGATLSADEAMELGIITAVVADEELDHAVEDLIADIRKVPWSVRQEYKRLLLAAYPFPAHRSIPVPETVDLLTKFLSRTDGGGRSTS